MELPLAYDILINLPITKGLAGDRITGTRKNLMGLNSPKTNRAEGLRRDRDGSAAVRPKQFSMNPSRRLTIPG
jgi:hypothetical protein